MYKHILLPVALDQEADLRRILDVASTLLQVDGDVTLFHAVAPIPIYVESYMPLNLQPKMRAAARERLDALAAQFGVAHAEVAYASPGHAIVDYAHENGVDCIVMASHRPALSDAILGSTAAWVVRHAKVSVHVLR